MDFSKLTRDSSIVHKALQNNGIGIVATKPCKIYIPESYIGNFLGNIDEEIRIVGIFGISVEDRYFASSRTIAMFATDPSTTNIVEIDGENYMVFSYEPGDMVFKNRKLVKISTLAFRVFDEMVSKGRVPWYLSYVDMCFLFETAKYHADANLGVDSAILEMIMSSMARKKDNKSVFFRHLINKPTDIDTTDFTYVPLKSVAYGATNTSAKLLGSYFQEGMTSALITPSEQNESIEDLLRR